MAPVAVPVAEAVLPFWVTVPVAVPPCLPVTVFWAREERESERRMAAATDAFFMGKVSFGAWQM